MRRIIAIATAAVVLLPAAAASAAKPMDMVSIPFVKAQPTGETAAKGSSAVVSLGKLGRVE